MKKSPLLRNFSVAWRRDILQAGPSNDKSTSIVSFFDFRPMDISRDRIK